MFSYVRAYVLSASHVLHGQPERARVLQIVKQNHARQVLPRSRYSTWFSGYNFLISHSVHIFKNLVKHLQCIVMQAE